MSNWLKLDRPISRGSYFLAGLLLFLLKHNLDRLIALAYHRPWGVFNYLVPLQKAARVSSLSPDERSFLAALLFTAIPFVAVGVWLTLRRLRTLGLSEWLVVAFFLPMLLPRSVNAMLKKYSPPPSARNLITCSVPVVIACSVSSMALITRN